MFSERDIDTWERPEDGRASVLGLLEELVEETDDTDVRMRGEEIIEAWAESFRQDEGEEDDALQLINAHMCEPGVQFSMDEGELVLEATPQEPWDD